MAKYEIEYMCEHVETVQIEAETKEEAIEKFHNDDWVDIVDWYIDGKRVVQSMKKTHKNGKQLSILDYVGEFH